MIEPFEYEKKHMKPVVSENITDGGLDTSLLDAPMKKLNNWSKVPDFESYIADTQPYTRAHQEHVGRVMDGDNNKSDYQSEAISQLGSLVSGYDTKGGAVAESGGNASNRIHTYLDKEVGFIPRFMETIDSINNVKIDDPVLQPGISFIDSRKNVATRFK